MKITTLLCFALCMCTAAKAQTGFAIEAGANYAKDRFRVATDFKDTKIRNGFRAGAVVDVRIFEELYMQPGIFYAANGFKINSEEGHEEYSINSIEVPVYFNYRFYVGNGNFFAGGGPVFGYNINGDYYHLSQYYVETGRDLRIGDKKTDDLRQYNFALGANGGYQFGSGLYFRASVQKGIYNMQPKGNSNNLIRSVNYCLSLGFMFYDR